MPRFPLLSATLLVCLLAASEIAAERAGVEREVAPQTSGRSAGLHFSTQDRFAIWTDHRAVSHSLAFGRTISGWDGRHPFPSGIPLFLNPYVESQADALVVVDGGWVAAWREDGASYARRIDQSGAFVGSPVPLYEETLGPILISKARGSLLFTNPATGRPAYLATLDLRDVRRIELPNLHRFAISSSGDDHVLFFDCGTALRIHPDWTQETIRLELPDRFAIAWTRRDYLVVYATAGGVFGRRLSADLKTLGEEFLIAPTGPLIATHLVVYASSEAGSAGVSWVSWGPFHTIVHPDNSVDPPRPVPPSVPPAPPPPIASLAAQLMFAAPRDGSDGSFLYVEKDDYGSRVIGASQALSPHDRFAEMPAIATHDRGGLAVWMEQGPAPRVLAGRIIGGAGGRFVIGPGNTEWMRWNRFTANSYTGAPSVVWSGQMYFVAWTAGSRIAHARVLENGTLLDTEPQRIDPIHQGDGQTNPVATRVGDKILLVWTEGARGGCAIVCSDLPAKIRAARFTLDGQLIDTRIIASEPYSTFADVAAAGDTALIAWQHEQRIYVRRMTSSGFVFEASRVLVAEGTRPSVARHGDGFVVAWQSPATPRGERHHTIHAAFVSRDGVAGEPFLVARETWQPNGPFAWTRPDGSAAIAYGRMSYATGLVPRLFYRVVTDEPPSRRRRAVR